MNDINKYLKNQKIIDYNEYTGIFENKNLIKKPYPNTPNLFTVKLGILGL